MKRKKKKQIENNLRMVLHSLPSAFTVSDTAGCPPCHHSGLAQPNCQQPPLWFHCLQLHHCSLHLPIFPEQPLGNFENNPDCVPFLVTTPQGLQSPRNEDSRCDSYPHAQFLADGTWILGLPDAPDSVAQSSLCTCWSLCLQLSHIFSHWLSGGDITHEHPSVLDMVACTSVP